MKYIQKETRSILFLKDWWRNEDENGSFVCEHGDFVKGETNKTMNSHVMRGKNEKFLKTVLQKTFIMQNMRFSWLDWVANKWPKTCVTNLEKFVLSIFRKWKGPFVS